MSRVISFCPRQVCAGGTTDTDIYSDVFDVSDYAELDVQLQCLGTSNVTAPVITVMFEGNPDPSLGQNQWNQVGSTLTLNVTGVAEQTITYFQRFLRAKTTIKSGKYVTMCLQGVAKESS